MLDFCDRGVVVTGASSGIGRQISLLLAERGARLALCARRLERLQELRREIEKKGFPVPLIATCDVGDNARVEEFRDQAQAMLGTVDVLINNAGRGAFKPIEQLSPEEAKAVVDVNLLGVVYCTRAFLPGMLGRGSGHLVFISSVLGELPAPEHAVYGATKFAVSGLAESLDYELGPRGIKVTLIEPGLVRTEFAEVSGTPLERFEQMPSKTAEEAALRLRRDRPVGDRLPAALSQDGAVSLQAGHKAHVQKVREKSRWKSSGAFVCAGESRPISSLRPRPSRGPWRPTRPPVRPGPGCGPCW